MKAIRFALVVAALSGSLPSHAAPMFFDSEAAFLAGAAGIPLTLEDFEAYAGVDAPSPVVLSITDLASGLNITSNTHLRDRNNQTACRGSSSCVAFITPSFGSSVSFSFDGGTVSAFGLFVGEAGTLGTTTLSFLTSTGETQSYAVAGGRDNERFFGVVDTQRPFVSVTMTNTLGSDVVYLDEVRFGSNKVSEPGSLALAGLSLAAFCAACRRKA